MAEEILWRFLVVDDRQANETEEFLEGNRVLPTPNRVIVEKCTNFKNALESLNEKRIDLVILDLKDDSIDLEEDKPLAGEAVFTSIQQSRFVPVIFYTAYAQKVTHLENPYVRVVTRGEERRLREAIVGVFDTGLPRLIRHLETEQKTYMWDHVGTKWQNPKTSYDKTDLSYLLARRLANTLERNSIRRFLAGQDGSGPTEDVHNIHPIEMYIFPSTNLKLQAGDILKGLPPNQDTYWVVMTPSCDIEQDKVTHVVLASCTLLSEQPEFIKVQEYTENGQTVSDSAKGELNALISNNRKGKKVQPERYYFLPGTFFIPDLVLDFQALIHVSLDEALLNLRIASLDSPFAEACLARFSRYYGRLGTPDVDKDFVYKKIVESIPKKARK